MQVPDSYRIDDYCYSSNLRKPLAGLFRAGQFDFWAIGLHLKSGYGGQSACTNAVRKMQVYYIAKQLDTLKKSDRDIVIIGDFNASEIMKACATSMIKL
jgi:predicted extracellular nuclease